MPLLVLLLGDAAASTCCWMLFHIQGGGCGGVRWGIALPLSLVRLIACDYASHICRDKSNLCVHHSCAYMPGVSDTGNVSK